MIKNEGVKCKAVYKNTVPYIITDIYTNGNIHLQQGQVLERISIRRLKPYFGEDMET